jgi:hypothetical protein
MSKELEKGPYPALRVFLRETIEVRESSVAEFTFAAVAIAQSVLSFSSCWLLRCD